MSTSPPQSTMPPINDAPSNRRPEQSCSAATETPEAWASAAGKVLFAVVTAGCAVVTAGCAVRAAVDCVVTAAGVVPFVTAAVLS